jgi:acetylornithine deacetylase/succinyl-diaminopimelate desuccinylase-like protein
MIKEPAMPTSDAARSYARAQTQQYVEELKEFLRIPSLSGDPERAADVRRAAEWLVEHMRSLGLSNAAVMETAGHPVAYGEWMGAGPGAPTMLVYGHYDVVPASLEDGWESDPWEPDVRDGKIFARGATDDKGQLFIHVKALEAWLKSGGAAPVNVKFLIEGEEEVASPNLRPFIEEHLEMLKADVVVVSDTSMPTREEPAVTHSLRGMTYLEFEVFGPRDDLHSGFFGGATHNPGLALVEILHKLYNEDGTIAVPGFYDDVVPLTEDERAMVAKTGITEEQFKESTGVPAVWGDERFTIKERVSARPTLDINGLWGGWSGPGPKTIIPSKAGCKISSRLVGNQDPQKIFEQIKSFIESVTPPTVRVEVRLINTGMPALIPYDLPAMQAASRAYERGWGHVPVFTRGGGSIPVVSDMYALLDAPVVMMGYGLDSDGLHAANEHYNVDMFERGIETAIVYMEELANLPQG